MSIIFALKILTDLCYFMFAISSVTSKFDHSGLLFTSPVIVAVSAFFSAWIAEHKPRSRWLRMVPLLLCGCAFLFTKTAIDYVNTIPMVLYVFIVAWLGRYRVGYSLALERFFLLLKILPVVAVLTIVANNMDGFTSVMIPYFFFFLIFTVMLLRMLRHSEDVARDRKFTIMNTLEIGLVCGFGYLLSTGQIVTLFRLLFGAVMDYVVQPVMKAVGFVLSLIPKAIGAISKLFNVDLPTPDLRIDLSDIDFSELQTGQEMPDKGDMAVMEFYAEEAAKGGGDKLKYVGIALAVIIMVVLAVILFRVLMRMGRRDDDNQFSDTREAVTDEPGEDRLTRSARDRVRSCYRKFLRVCVKEGLDPDLNLNSRQVNQSMVKVLDVPAMDGLRDIYIRARYSSEEISEDDVKTAKQMLGLAKKAGRESEKRRAKVDRSAGA